MYEKQKHQMERISSYAGERKDYVQGGGGNTSVKFNDRLMAIKASGYLLTEVAKDSGYVTVDYSAIRKYYDTVDTSEKKDFEKESLEASLGSVVLLEGMQDLRPSVEVGFHSFLKRCVIHTHSVYANMLCCSYEGREKADEIFNGSGISYTFLPYIDPGFTLTLAMRDALLQYSSKMGSVPDVVFLENHGIIVHGEDAEAAIAIHEKVNEMIKAHFKIDKYPEPKIKEEGEGYESATKFLRKFVENYEAGEEYFKNLRLYPDLLVYAGRSIGKKVRIRENSIIYDTNEKEAQTIEETLLGAAYVIDAINKAGMTLRQMDEKGAAFIDGWESEKYRANLIK